MSGAMPRSPWKTRYFIDTEFTDFAADRQLISVAIASEDGREFYGELTDFDASKCSCFVREVVLPQLGQYPDRVFTREALANGLLDWLHAVPLKPKPVLSYDYQGDFDLLLELIGGPLPRGWKHENVSLRINPERAAEYYRAHGGEHHALHDARANALAFT